jgi:hypothetical protein
VKHLLEGKGIQMEKPSTIEPAQYIAPIVIEPAENKAEGHANRAVLTK